MDGVIVEKMSKSPLYVYTMEGLNLLLRESIGAEWLIRQEQPITCRRSEPEPDLAVVRGTRADYFRAHPAYAELIIEVAISSSEIDAEKAAIYAQATVREYWIVLPEEKRVEVYTQPVGLEYIQHRTFVFPQVAASEAFPDFRLDLSTFFPG